MARNGNLDSEPSNCERRTLNTELSHLEERTMKPKTTILIVLAIGCGLAAAFMTNKLIADRSKAPGGR